MQKVVSFRASQSDLNDKLNEFTKRGWKVVNVAKGSDLNRVGISYTWTVVLDIPDNSFDPKQIDKILNEDKSELSSSSFGVALLLSLGILIAIGTVFALVYLLK